MTETQFDAEPIKNLKNVLFKIARPNGFAEAAWIKIHRPDKRNAIDFATMDELNVVLAHLEARPHLSCVVLTGSGQKAFISGGDLDEFKLLNTRERALEMAHRMGGTLDRLRRLDAVTIAAVNGHAIGGGAEVALCCDLCVMSDEARLMLRQIDLGVVPGLGGLTRLVKRFGYTGAMRLFLLDRDIGAKEAAQLGVCARVFPAATFDQDLQTLIANITALSPLAVRALKHVATRLHDIPASAAREYEAEIFATVWNSADHWEALDAFFEKRKPKFKGS